MSAKSYLDLISCLCVHVLVLWDCMHSCFSIPKPRPLGVHKNERGFVLLIWFDCNKMAHENLYIHSFLFWIHV